MGGDADTRKPLIQTARRQHKHPTHANFVGKSLIYGPLQHRVDGSLVLRTRTHCAGALANAVIGPRQVSAANIGAVSIYHFMMRNMVSQWVLLM